VYVEDQVRRAAVEVGHLDQGAAGAVGDEGSGRGEVCAWEQDLVAGCAGFADGSYGFLDGRRPGIDVEVVLEDLVSMFSSIPFLFKLGIRASLTGSFIRPKAILVLPLYLAAICDQRLVNWAFVGPPWPTIPPFQRA